MKGNPCTCCSQRCRFHFWHQGQHWTLGQTTTICPIVQTLMYRSNQVRFLQSLAETDLWSWFAPAPPSTITTSGREIAVWCEISPYHETGSLTSCPANEGVLAVSKMSQWGSLFCLKMQWNSGQRQKNLLKTGTQAHVLQMSEICCLYPKLLIKTGPKREPHKVLLIAGTPSLPGHGVRLPFS